MIPLQKFEHDQVKGWTPISFGLEFVRQMRFKKLNLKHRPSIRTSLAIPKFLTARYFRKRLLNYTDYIEAATFNTPYEDQAKAKTVARDILFPKDGTETKKRVKDQASDDVADSSASPTGADSILAGLGDLNLDLDDFGDLDEMLAQAEQESGDLSSFDFFEQLLSSEEDVDQSLVELLKSIGGPSEMEVNGVVDHESAGEFCSEALTGLVGDLTPEQIKQACACGFGQQLCRETSLPWELAGSLAGNGNLDSLQHHLDDLFQTSTAAELGKTAKYLDSFFTEIGKETFDRVIAEALKRVKSLADFISLLDALGYWVDPPAGLIDYEAVENPRQALKAADWIRERFDRSFHEQIFYKWADSLGRTPAIEELIPLYVPLKRYDELLDEAYQDFLSELRQGFASASADEQPGVIQKAVQMGSNLKKQSVLLSNLASILATDVLELPNEAELFLTLLENLLSEKIMPHDTERVVAKGSALRIDPEEIYQRLGRAFEQLKQMIHADIRDVARYLQLLTRIGDIPFDEVADLVAICEHFGNLEAMATLMALAMGPAAGACSDESFALASIGFKGIGGGDNLLKQWFTHGQNLPGSLRAQIKQLAKTALLDLGLEWSASGNGSLSDGMIPQSRVRPYTGADDMDSLDIENTLDLLTSAGKPLEWMSEDDLLVHDTQQGQAAMLVLIDISGSMSGDDLAMCAMSVVMLLGKLMPNEIAIALFESDTHVVKTFSNDADLDAVADDLLDLKGRGGTCVDAALRWSIEQFQNHPTAVNQTLFLLSDFCFYESADDLRKVLEPLSDLGIRYLGAAHGYIDGKMQNLFQKMLGGDNLKITSLEQLPELLTNAINSLGSN